MLARNLRTTPRSIEEVTKLIEVYPESWRRWCNGPETGGCACLGCVRHPAPSTVRGDPEYRAWPNEEDALIEEEVALYREIHPEAKKEGEYWDGRTITMKCPDGWPNLKNDGRPDLPDGWFYLGRYPCDWIGTWDEKSFGEWKAIFDD